MSAGAHAFEPGPSLLPGSAHPECVAGVIIPARNEEEALGACLDAFAAQRDLQGAPLPANSFEVLLLLNNCTDASPEVSETWRREHPEANLHVLSCELTGDAAHVGTARKLLMDTAWSRLHNRASAAILSTDADTVVAPDWIAQNLRCLREGAEAVGGFIQVRACDLRKLPPDVQEAYARDRRYAALVAELEAYLDPQPGDPCPRHVDHFGASLACTVHAYAHAGGMPAVSPLEDEAFVMRLRRAGVRLRHDPAVRVCTSGRLAGRATLGVAAQLRCWSRLPPAAAHTVQLAAWVEHRFRTLRLLRQAFGLRRPDLLPAMPDEWFRWCVEVLGTAQTETDFFSGVDSDGLIHQGFCGTFEQPATAAIEELEALLAHVRLWQAGK